MEYYNRINIIALIRNVCMLYCNVYMYVLIFTNNIKIDDNFYGYN